MNRGGPGRGRGNRRRICPGRRRCGGRRSGRLVLFRKLRPRDGDNNCRRDTHDENKPANGGTGVPGGRFVFSVAGLFRHFWDSSWSAERMLRPASCGLNLGASRPVSSGAGTPTMEKSGDAIRQRCTPSARAMRAANKSPALAQPAGSSFQPSRYCFVSNRVAASEFGMRNAAASHSSVIPGIRVATFPSSTASASGPA